MVRVPLIVAPVLAVAACAGTAQPPANAPVAPDSALAGSAATTPADTLWDQGTFVVVDKDVVAPGTEETFQIHRTATGYRLQITWKRPLPTGEPADGTVTLETDARFSPIRGDDVMSLRLPAGVEVTKSSLRRDPDGRLTTEVIAAGGHKDTNRSTGRNDFFIGGRTTTFLTALCQASPDQTAPVVYPDKQTSLDVPKLLPIEGTTRDVTYRVLTYVESQNRVVVACEDGKLVGEVARGVTIVRAGDMKLAQTLERSFR